MSDDHAARKRENIERRWRSYLADACHTKDAAVMREVAAAMGAARSPEAFAAMHGLDWPAEPRAE